MTRITISLPADVAAALEREARRRRVPVSQVAREAIEANLGLAEGTRKEPALIGLFTGMGLPVDAAERFDELLAETWARDVQVDALDRDR